MSDLSVESSRDKFSRRQFLKGFVKRSVGVAAYVGVGVNHGKITADKKPEPEVPLHCAFCSNENSVISAGDWNVTKRSEDTTLRQESRSQEDDIDTSGPLVIRSYEIANRILRTETEWNVPDGLTIYVGIYKEKLIYEFNGQKFEALATTKRNWEGPDPKPEAHILLSSNAHDWPPDVLEDIIRHEVGHALKVLYYDSQGGSSEHNPDINSVMYWRYDIKNNPITKEDRAAVSFRPTVLTNPGTRGMSARTRLPHVAADK